MMYNWMQFKLINDKNQIYVIRNFAMIKFEFM